MNLLLLAVIVVVVAWLYIVFARPQLEQRVPRVWGWIDKVEGALWKRSRTILVSRLYWVGGAVIAVHDKLAEQNLDWTPMLTQITNVVPETYRPLALAGFVTLTGVAFEWLRRQTDKPAGQ